MTIISCRSNRTASLALLLVAFAAFPTSAQVELWDWPAGQGVGASGHRVQELLAWDDGNGLALFVGGLFTKVGGKEIPWIARWYGNEWSSLGTGLGSMVDEMLVFDDGGGPALFVIGSFEVPSSHIAKWNGVKWLPVGAGFVWPLRGMTVFDDGTGAALYVGGNSRVSKWDGRSWELWTGGYPSGYFNQPIYSLATLGPELYAGGEFTTVGRKAASRLAKWDGKEWSAVAEGVTSGSAVTKLAAFTDSGGPKLFVTGYFDEVGGIPAKGMAILDKQTWVSGTNGLKSANGRVEDFAIFDFGSGPSLYSYGGGNGLSRWTGTGWQFIDIGPDFGAGNALAAFTNESGKLTFHVGGSFSLPEKGWTNIARYTGPISGGTPCGDLTGDGFVNQQDLGVLLGDFGCTKGLGLCPGDCDLDGDTDQADLGILLANWEKPCP